MPHERIQLPRVAEAAEAAAIARKLLDAGADGLKLYTGAPGRNGGAVDDGVIEALVKEGHSRGKPVFVHPTNTAGLMASVRAGVDVLAHTTPQSGPWNESILAAMSQARVALIPTLSFWRYQVRHERISVADSLEENAIGQLRSWVGAGGVVLFGTDLGWVTAYNPTGEYVLMAKAGMTFPQILASLTTAPAERFGDFQTTRTYRPRFQRRSGCSEKRPFRGHPGARRGRVPHFETEELFTVRHDDRRASAASVAQGVTIPRRSISSVPTLHAILHRHLRLAGHAVPDAPEFSHLRRCAERHANVTWRSRGRIRQSRCRSS